MRELCLLLLTLPLFGASCHPIIEDSSSAFASEAGHSTIALGACSADFNRGWGECLLEKGQATFPTLRLIFTNPGDYAVSDCELGLYKTGAIDKPGLVEIDLSGLRAQAEKLGMCILKIEAVERYPDPGAKNVLRSIFMRGGLFIELVDAGYMPTPAADVTAFCVKVERTTKGRTKVSTCTP